MAVPNTKEEELSAGELASYGISPQPPAEPKLVRSQEPEEENNHDGQRSE
jgi:hypothetical protein